MNGSIKNNGLLQELERADTLLTKVFEKLANFNEILKPIELELRVNDFSSSSIIIPGSINGIVCALTALVKGDPLSLSLEALQGKGLNLPSIIKSADRNESRSTCYSILKIIESSLDSIKPRFVVNLRWSKLPSLLMKKKVIIIGNRYSSLENVEKMKLSNKLEQQSIDVLEDSGEYGGGILVYHLLESIDYKRKTTIFELTLSKEMAGDEKQLGFILQALSTL